MPDEIRVLAYADMASRGHGLEGKGGSKASILAGDRCRSCHGKLAQSTKARGYCFRSDCAPNGSISGDRVILGAESHG